MNLHGNTLQSRLIIFLLMLESLQADTSLFREILCKKGYFSGPFSATLVGLILYIPVNNFSVMLGWVVPVHGRG